ncbi:hypothetical protein D3C78_1881730 [compost metagenome]
MPPSEARTTPEVIITVKSGLVDMIEATWMLLVITRSPLWVLVSACATASMVVPMLMNSEAWSGMFSAIMSAMCAFSLCSLPLRAK